MRPKCEPDMERNLFCSTPRVRVCDNNPNVPRCESNVERNLHPLTPRARTCENNPNVNCPPNVKENRPLAQAPEPGSHKACTIEHFLVL